MDGRPNKEHGAAVKIKNMERNWTRPNKQRKLDIQCLKRNNQEMCNLEI